METITIPVDADIAQAYRQANPQQQQNAILICNILLKDLLQPTNFQELVQQIRQEAAANGLTPEILEELLQND